MHSELKWGNLKVSIFQNKTSNFSWSFSTSCSCIGRPKANIYVVLFSKARPLFACLFVLLAFFNLLEIIDSPEVEYKKIILHAQDFIKKDNF